MLIFNKLNRRNFISAFGATAVLFSLPTAGFSLSKPEAEKLINDLSADIMRVINSGKSETAMYKDFNRIFGKYAAVDAIARTCLGPPWRSASSSQKNAYLTAFRSYLSRKYGKRFREFIGSEIKVVSAKSVKSGVLVKSKVKLRGRSPFDVEWQVFERNGKRQMFDLYIEGISMIKSEREQIGIMLDKSGGDINKLVKRLNAAG